MRVEFENFCIPYKFRKNKPVQIFFYFYWFLRESIFMYIKENWHIKRLISVDFEFRNFLLITKTFRKREYV